MIRPSGYFIIILLYSYYHFKTKRNETIAAIEEIARQESDLSSSVALVSLTSQPDPVDTEPPVFKQTFGNANIEEGGPLILDCTITGRPVPQVGYRVCFLNSTRLSYDLFNLFD